MEKINIAELLKDCPKGMELDCVLFDNVKFEECTKECIYIRLNNGELFALTKYGNCLEFDISKCIIYPKNKTTWEGFVPPRKFKDGDIVTSNNGEYIFMLKKARLYPNDDVYKVYNGTCYFGLAVNSEFLFKKESEWYFNRLATEEEKQKLFDAIKSNGYRWDTEKKSLKKLIEPEFKVGDRVRLKNDKTIITTINYIYRDSYGCDNQHLIFFEEQDNYELVLTKFDINTLVPFESRVLVRDYSYGVWKVSFWGCLLSNEYGFVYDTTRGGYKQCIPYEGNEHLLGTTNDCDSYFKTWE